MKPECMIKLRGAGIPKAEWERLEAAYKAGDEATWAQILVDELEIKQKNKFANMHAANALHRVSAEANKAIPEVQDLPNATRTKEVKKIAQKPLLDLSYEIEAKRSLVRRYFTDFLHATRPTFLGLRRASNPDMVRAYFNSLFGETTEKMLPHVKAFRDAWFQSAEKIKEQYEAAGIKLTEYDGLYTPPVLHSSLKVGNASFDQWKSVVNETMTLRRHPKISQAITDDEILKVIYDKIRREKFGLEDMRLYPEDDVSNISWREARGLFRSLQPKDGDSYIRYLKQFGEIEDPISMLNHYIDMSAKGIAIAERFGPKPRAVIEAFSSQLEYNTGTADIQTHMNSIYDTIVGANPQSESWAVNALRGLRAFQSINKLQSVAIAQINDTSTMAVRGAYNGLNITRMMERLASNLLTAKDFKFAMKAALIGNYTAKTAVDAFRFSESMGLGTLERLTDFFMRAYGVNHWTNAAKTAVALEWSSTLAEVLPNKFHELPKKLRRAFERHGVDEKLWSSIPKEAIEDYDGSKFFNPGSELLTNEQQMTLLRMIRNESAIMVPEANVVQRNMLAFGTKPGSLGNELMLTFMQFKPFAWTTLMNNWAMVTDKAVPIPTRVGYAASLFTLSTITGYLSYQLYEVSQGRKPAPLDGTTIWQSVARGGYFGVATDMVSPFAGQSLADSFMGPSVSDATRIVRSVNKMATSDKPLSQTLPGELEGAAERVVPGLKLPFARVAVDRLVLDYARRMTDADYYSRKRRTDQTMRERKQEFWSSPR